MIRVSLVSLIPMVFLIAGVCLASIWVVNILNGTFLEPQYMWMNMEVSQEFYAELIADNATGAYTYNNLTDTGDLIFKLFCICFGIGVLSVIIPKILAYHGK